MANPSPSMALLIEQAAAGNAEAIHNFLQYLNSSNPDLRHLLQIPLHAAAQPAIWQCMLGCISGECWPAAAGESSPQGKTTSSPAPKPEIVTPRGIQSMIEVFVLDSSQDPETERRVKESVLTPALQSPERLTRWAAGYLHALRGNLDAVPVLDEIIRTPVLPKAGISIDLLLRWQLRAVQALAGLNHPACGGPLVEALASPERTLHHAAGQAISELGRNAEPALLGALHHPDPHVRWHAARALGQIGDLRAVATLAEGLYDDNQEVRWVTARVLANLDAPAIPAVLQVLADQEPSEALRQAAFHALNGMYALRQPEIRAYLQPLLDTLHRTVIGASTAVGTAEIARQLLGDWKNVARFYIAPSGGREDRHFEIP